MCLLTVDQLFSAAVSIDFVLKEFFDWRRGILFRLGLFSVYWSSDTNLLYQITSVETGMHPVCSGFCYTIHANCCWLFW